MNLFKTFTLKWWQAAIFKVGLGSLGIAVGVYWRHFFAGFLPGLIFLSALCLAYIAGVWAKQ